MSLACALYLGVPDRVAGTPRFSARRAARLACHKPYLASRNMAPKSSVVASRPLSSRTLAKVMSTYRSSWPSELLTRSGVQGVRVAFEDRSFGFEFGRRAVADPDHLAGPAARDPVAQVGERDFTELPLRSSRGTCGNQHR